LYTAKDQAGQEVSGAVAAQSEQIAVAQLHQAGYFVTDIRPELRLAPRAGPPSTLQRAFHGVSSGDLAIMFREMATMIGAGMSMVRCLDVLEQNTSKPQLRAAIRSMQAGVERGEPLSAHLRHHDAIFPEISVATVEAAERSGRLDEMFRMLATYMEYEHEIRQTVRRETFYPKIIAAFIVIVLLVLIGLSVWQSGGSWFLAVVAILGLIGLGVSGTWLGLRMLSTSTYARQTWDAVKSSLPIIGKTVRRLAMSRFARALATMYEAGLSLPEGVRLSARACGNHYIAVSLDACVEHMRRGMKLSEALAATRVVPNTVLQMVVTGEESGQLGTTLSKVADYYEDEAKTAIHSMCVSILPVCLVVFGAIVLFMAIQFYLSYATGMLNM
jgi:type II secretory pathway component PulF